MASSGLVGLGAWQLLATRTAASGMIARIHVSVSFGARSLKASKGIGKDLWWFDAIALAIVPHSDSSGPRVCMSATFNPLVVS
jgi:hypothetical protein